MKIPKIQILFAIAIIAIIIGLCFAFLQVNHPGLLKWKYLLTGGGCIVLLFVLLQYFMTHVGQHIPRSVVLELLDRCKTEDREWVLVHFKPEVSPDEAQKRLGKEYSQVAREKQFMFKLSNVYALRPDIVVFYSKQKGLLCGNARAIKSLLKKYGRFMMDSWNCLFGVLRKNRLMTQSLDGGQLFSFRRGYPEHIGSDENV